MKSKIVLFSLLLVALAGCGPSEDKTNREALAKEIKGRKLKRITDAQVMEASFMEGKKIAEKLNKLIILDSVGTCESARFQGSLSASALLRYDFVCSQAQADALPAKAKEVWEAYKNGGADARGSDNVQKLSPNEVLYTTPLFTNEHFVGMWLVVLDKKELIRQM
jgi:hypothetical protein